MTRRIADGSVGSPHVRVGHRQALKKEEALPRCGGAFLRSGVIEKHIGTKQKTG